MYGVSHSIVITGVEPVTLAEAKEHLRVDFDTDDATITALVSAAAAYCESYVGYLLRTQTRKTLFNSFGTLKMYGPTASIESIEYTNENGDAATVPAANYQFTPTNVTTVTPVDEWPEDYEDGNVTVSYTAGLTPDEVPHTIRQAMLLILGDWYENPTNATRRFPTAAKAILDLERVTIL